jgi:hypothetical protein
MFRLRPVAAWTAARCTEIAARPAPLQTPRDEPAPAGGARPRCERGLKVIRMGQAYDYATAAERRIHHVKIRPRARTAVDRS